MNTALVKDGIAARLAVALKTATVHNYRYASSKMKYLAMFGVIGEPLFYFFWTRVNPEGFESATIRAIAAGLCVPLLFRPRPRSNELPVALYYCLTATYCFPFCFGYLLLMNAEAAATSGLAAVQWPMQYAVALVLLVMLFPMGPIAAI